MYLAMLLMRVESRGPTRGLVPLNMRDRLGSVAMPSCEVLQTRARAPGSLSRVLTRRTLHHCHRSHARAIHAPHVIVAPRAHPKESTTPFEKFCNIDTQPKRRNGAFTLHKMKDSAILQCYINRVIICLVLWDLLA